MRNLILLTLLLSFFFSFHSHGMLIKASQNWSDRWNGDFSVLFTKLERSPLGKKVLALAREKALKRGGHLEDFMGLGSASYTDFTLVRKKRGKIISYIQKSRIFLDSSLRVKRAVHDLAHELVHFIWQSVHNPYTEKPEKQGFQAYLQGGIEGRGGEVDAFMMECRIARELHPRTWDKGYPCRYISQNGKISRELAIKAFYRVGHKAAHFLNQQMKEVKLSSKEPILIAGSHNMPYPISLFSQFQEMKKKLCQGGGKGRRPASSLCDEKSL